LVPPAVLKIQAPTPAALTGLANTAHSISYLLLAAPLARLGRLEEASAAAARVLERQPAFRYSLQFSGVDCAPALANSLGAALRLVGLPE
jgi:hypothetical protein